jgi:hypothetical protein
VGVLRGRQFGQPRVVPIRYLPLSLLGWRKRVDITSISTHDQTGIRLFERFVKDGSGRIALLVNWAIM